MKSDILNLTSNISLFLSAVTEAMNPEKAVSIFVKKF